MLLGYPCKELENFLQTEIEKVKNKPIHEDKDE